MHFEGHLPVTTQFISNIGSPQGDSISGPLFTIYFKRALQKLREAINSEPIDVRDINPQWIERENSNLPKEMEYADDCDFLTLKIHLSVFFEKMSLMIIIMMPLWNGGGGGGMSFCLKFNFNLCIWKLMLTVL